MLSCHSGRKKTTKFEVSFFLSFLFFLMFLTFSLFACLFWLLETEFFQVAHNTLNSLCCPYWLWTCDHFASARLQTCSTAPQLSSNTLVVIRAYKNQFTISSPLQCSRFQFPVSLWLKENKFLPVNTKWRESIGLILLGDGELDRAEVSINVMK